jgi:hypothetical protein
LQKLPFAKYVTRYVCRVLFVFVFIYLLLLLLYYFFLVLFVLFLGFFFILSFAVVVCLGFFCNLFCSLYLEGGGLFVLSVFLCYYFCSAFFSLNKPYVYIHVTSLVQLSVDDNQVSDVNHSKVKSQSHFMVKAKCQRNPYILSSCYQINSQLGVKVVHGLPLS